MAIEETNIEQTKTHWFIDLDWYQLNGRSFSFLLSGAFVRNVVNVWILRKQS